VIAQHEATIVANSASGVFYGVQTFKQLLPLPGEPRVLPTGTVRDWPAMKYRGIHDDLSRGPFQRSNFRSIKSASLRRSRSIFIHRTLSTRCFIPISGWPRRPAVRSRLTKSRISSPMPPVSRDDRAGAGGLWAFAPGAEV